MDKVKAQERKISRLKIRIENLKQSPHYQNWFSRLHKRYLTKMKWLQDELKTEQSILYRMKDV